MATGTSGGLLDDPEGHAQSVFKHAILSRYMLPFVSMVGSTSSRGRIVVVDGYAGRGRYRNGQPGSAELILQVIKRFRHSRQVLAYFVEKEPKEHAALAAVVAEYGRQGLLARALPGAVEDHLGTIIAAADGYPLFLFLDPCGAVVPFDQLATVIAGRQRSRRPQTELLLNFSAGLSRRAAGVLRAGRIDDPIIAKMDVTCGGRWWRTTALEALRSSSTGNFEPAAAAVADEYARGLARAGSMTAVTVPVGRRINRQPIFHLVFMTRSPYGLWVFADALAQARQEWLHAVGDAHGDDGGTLFTMADYMSQQIDADLAQAAKIVTANLREIVKHRPAFKFVEHARTVFGEAYGVATEAVIRRAVADLVSKGELAHYGNASRFRDRYIGRPRNLLAGPPPEGSPGVPAADRTGWRGSSGTNTLTRAKAWIVVSGAVRVAVANQSLASDSCSARPSAPGQSNRLRRAPSSACLEARAARAVISRVLGASAWRVLG
jgi:three-Cys-motif partner protein